MGTLADSLFSVLMAWVRALVNALWALLSSDHTTALEFLSKNWMIVAAVIIAAGLVIDWIIYLLRWQPYRLWAQRARKALRIEAPPEDEEEYALKAHAAMMPERRYMRPQEAQETSEPAAPAQTDEQEARAAMDYAHSAPDEHAYPGMRFDSVPGENTEATQRFGAVTVEGPGAAQARRRRAEIDAWRAQMQEEAQARAEAEQERQAEAARMAEQARREEEARLAEQARLEEEARLAQERYARELEEYERQKAQYELELAEYERRKAAYDAMMAAQQAEQEPEIAPQDDAEEAIYDLPDAPEWPQMEQPERAPKRHAAAKKREKEPKAKEHKLLSRMASMIEPEEQIISRTALPPRVDMHDAFRPAAEPQEQKNARRGRKS